MGWTVSSPTNIGSRHLAFVLVARRRHLALVPVAAMMPAPDVGGGGDAMRGDPRGTPFRRRVPRGELSMGYTKFIDASEQRARKRAIRDSSRLLLALRAAHPEGGNRDMMLRPKKIARPADGKRKREYKHDLFLERDLLLAAIRII